MSFAPSFFSRRDLSFRFFINSVRSLRVAMMVRCAGFRGGGLVEVPVPVALWHFGTLMCYSAGEWTRNCQWSSQLQADHSPHGPIPESLVLEPALGNSHSPRSWVTIVVPAVPTHLPCLLCQWHP